jgi:hypothetical protein
MRKNDLIIIGSGADGWCLMGYKTLLRKRAAVSWAPISWGPTPTN